MNRPNGGAPAGLGQSAPNAESLEETTSWLRDFFRESPSWLTSLIVHMAILLFLALWMLPSVEEEVLGVLNINTAEAPVEDEILEIVEEFEELDIDVDPLASMEFQPDTTTVADVPIITDTHDVEAAAVHVELVEIGIETAPKNDLLREIGAATGSGLSGRGAAARQALIRAGGGTLESEKAVARALKWFAAHQMPDGGWSFDHRHSPKCQGRCSVPGSLANMRNGATAMALLPFLGAGQTHKDGEYKDVVKSGLYYLASNMKVSNKGGSLEDPGHGMYSHGLAAIALCEAYGMTQDRALMAPAQAVVTYCATGQDRVTGGWGYNHGSGNDTSVAGWQIMALKSGHMAYLSVPPQTVRGCSLFLDSVQADSGATYGYRGPGNGAATSAVGLLNRMYLGWRQDHPALVRGVERLARMGPSPSGLYYNYYATQVLFQNTGGKGAMWAAWNEKLRDRLVSTQSTEGHTEGSWSTGDFASRGGRLYCTSMATMILEVYYRHMPIYREQATTDDFPD